MREKGYASVPPTRTEYKGPAGIHLTENQSEQISGRMSKVALPKAVLLLSALPAPEHGGSNRSEPGFGLTQIWVHTRAFYLVQAVWLETLRLFYGGYR